MCIPISPVDGCSDCLQLLLNLLIPVAFWLPITLLLLQQAGRIGPMICGAYMLSMHKAGMCRWSNRL